MFADGFLRSLFRFDDFIPHGHCYFWRTDIIALMAGSDILIALAYYSIPLALIYFAVRRKDLVFRGLFVMFGLFILACGTTHVISVVTIWAPMYRLDALMKAVTAVISVSTAVMLWPHLPKALALPSVADLTDANRKLAQEIVERNRTENALIRSEARFRLLVDGIRDYAILRLNPDGAIVSWNAGAHLLTGFEAADMLGQHVRVLFTDEDVQTGIPAMELARAAHIGRVEHEGWRVRKDGRLFWANVITTALIDEDHTLTGFGMVLRDVTDRKNYDDERRRVHEELEERVRLRTLDLEKTSDALRNELQLRREAELNLRDSLGEKEMLLREIHHRVKNNLQIISSIVSLHATRNSDAGISGSFEDLQHRVRAIGMVHDLLYTSTHVGRIAFRIYLQELTQYLSGLGASGTNVILECADIELDLDAAVHCGLITNELVTNALKHAFPGISNGLVTVRAKMTDDQHLLLEVMDNGKGMESSKRTEKSLGLTLVEIMAAQMQGQVHVETGGGTRIALTLHVVR